MPTFSSIMISIFSGGVNWRDMHIVRLSGYEHLLLIEVVLLI